MPTPHDTRECRVTEDLNQMREHMLTAIAASAGLDALEACRV